CGDFFVGFATDEEQLHALDFLPVALLAPVIDLLADSASQRIILKLAALAAAGDAAGRAAAAGHLPRSSGAGGRRRKRQRGPATFATQVVSKLMGCDREEVAFQRPPCVVV